MRAAVEARADGPLQLIRAASGAPLRRRAATAGGRPRDRLPLPAILALSLAAYVVGAATAPRASSRPTATRAALAAELPRRLRRDLGRRAGARPRAPLALFQGSVIDALLSRSLPDDADRRRRRRRQLSCSSPRSTTSPPGRIFAEPTPEIAAAAERLDRWTASRGSRSSSSRWRRCSLGLFFARIRLAPRFRARNGVERALSAFMIVCSVVAILTTVGIIASLLFEAWAFFALVPPHEFFFGLKLGAADRDPRRPGRRRRRLRRGAGVPRHPASSPTIAMPSPCRSGSSPRSTSSSTPPTGVRNVVKPMLEILAGVPTVVYGFFAVLTVAPAIRAGRRA